MKTAALIIMTNLPEKNGVIASMRSAGSVPVGQRMIAAFQRAQVSLIVVVTGPDGKMVEQKFAQNGVLFLRNQQYHSCSIMDSVRMGLRFLGKQYDRILITPGDVPLFRPATVDALLASGAPVAVPVYRKMHGFPICVDRYAAEKLLEGETTSGLEGAVRTCPAEKAWISVPDPGVVIRTEGLGQKKEAIARHNELLLRPVVEITLNGELSVYNEKLSTLLHLVDETRSVRLACNLMQMSYSAAWHMLNSAEDGLGFPLIERIRGGSVGGSVLTGRGRKLMEAYDAFSAVVRENAAAAFGDYFPGSTGLESLHT
ncbi:MAG: NTP transferase domain-containing protein [Faecousia sp.]